MYAILSFIFTPFWGSQSSGDLREGGGPVMAKAHIWKPQVLNRVRMLVCVFHPTAQLWKSSGSEHYQKPVLRQKWMLPFTNLAWVDWPHSLDTVADIFVSCTTFAGCSSNSWFKTGHHATRGNCEGNFVKSCCLWSSWSLALVFSL